MGTDFNAVERTVVFVSAVVGALLNSTAKGFVCFGFRHYKTSFADCKSSMNGFPAFYSFFYHGAAPEICTAGKSKEGKIIPCGL